MRAFVIGLEAGGEVVLETETAAWARGECFRLNLGCPRSGFREGRGLGVRAKEGRGLKDRA